MDIKNITTKSSDLSTELELIEQRRKLWHDETFSLLVNGLTRLNQSVEKKFSVTSSKNWERFETFTNREYVGISYGPTQSGIKLTTKDGSGSSEETNIYLIERGSLNYSQAFNGMVNMRIYNPRIERIITPTEEYRIYSQITLEPKDVTPKVVIEHFELLLDCLLDFFRYQDSDNWSIDTIGFKQGDQKSADDDGQ